MKNLNGRIHVRRIGVSEADLSPDDYGLKTRQAILELVNLVKNSHFPEKLLTFNISRLNKEMVGFYKISCSLPGDPIISYTWRFPDRVTVEWVGDNDQKMTGYFDLTRQSAEMFIQLISQNISTTEKHGSLGTAAITNCWGLPQKPAILHKR